MRYLKYAAVFLLLLSVLAAVIHFYREPIARGLANAALNEYGITATELSIQTLRPDYLRLSHLVLDQDDGTRYRISELSFPLDFSSTRVKSVSMEQLLVTPADTGSVPAPLSRLLQTFLQLPSTVPNTSVTVSHFEMPHVAPMENLLWRCGEQQQHLAFSIDAVDVTVDIDRVDDDYHQATVRASVDGKPDALSLTLSVHRSDSGFSIDGLSTIILSPWLAVLKSIGMLPADVVSLRGEVDGPFTIVLDDDATRSVAANAHLSLNDAITADYRVSKDQGIRLGAKSLDGLRLGFEYPSLEWTSSVRQVDILIGINANDDIAARLSNVECRAGFQCTAHASLDTGPLELETSIVNDISLSASLTVSGDETLRIDISPDTVVTLKGIESESLSVTSMTASRFFGAQLAFVDHSWRADIGHLALMFESLTDRHSWSASSPVTVNNLHLRDDGAAFDTEFSVRPDAATVSLDGNGIIVPGIDGELSLKNDLFAASLGLSDDENTLSAKIDASHNLVTGEGSISVRDATLLFNREKLSGRVLNWPYAWDIVTGTFSTDVGLNWKTGDSRTDYHGTMTFQADNLAGNYNDTVFTGLNSSLTAILDSMSGVTTLPSSIDVTLLDIGLPLEKITANFAFNVREQSIQVQNLSMLALGGRLVTDPFIFGMHEEANNIVLRPQSIQLQFMVDLAEFEGLELSGSISGVLPATINNKTVTIAAGRLENDPPGGVIRYLPDIDTAGAEVSDSALNLVSRALANFQFDSLTADVDYTESGDLVLQMKLTGINPDMDDKQPVILNLRVENNVPQLLRSLRAIRSIEDVFERRSQDIEE